MSFKAELEQFSNVVSSRKEFLLNEEMTKHSLIIPFLQKIGYDVFNPKEVQPEYTADFGIKKGEKVDYGILKDGKPIFFIEAKHINENLDKHDSQLSRYFNASPDVKFGILTNGLEYKLFTDLNKDNIMDEKPFYSFNIEELTVMDIEVINKFTKEAFNAVELLNFSEELVYLSNINLTLKNLFKNPTDDFVKFIIKDINNQRITSNVLERFRPIIKKAINQTLLEMIGESLTFSNNNPSDTENDEKIKIQEETVDAQKIEVLTASKNIRKTIKNY